MAMVAPFAATLMATATAIDAATTAQMVASMIDSATAAIMNENASRHLDQAKAALSLARKAHDLINAGI